MGVGVAGTGVDVALGVGVGDNTGVDDGSGMFPTTISKIALFSPK